MHPAKRSMVGLLVGLSLVLLGIPAARACVVRTGALSTKILRINGNRSRVIVTGYETAALTPSPDAYCVVGFGIGDAACISGVDSVLVRDTVADTIMTKFDFTANATTGSDFAGLQSADAWYGFLADVTQNVAGGTAVQFEWYIQNSASCDNKALVTAVQNSWFGTDDGDSAGHPTGGQQNIEQPGTVAVPTLGEWGLIALAGLVLIGGVYGLRRRRALQID